MNPPNPKADPIRETEHPTWNGILVVLVLLALVALCLYRLITSAMAGNIGQVIESVIVMVVAIFLLSGLFMVEPNQAKVLLLFGAYRGTAKVPGLRFANPFLTKKAISQRVRNFETEHLKVNDANGNPIEIAAVVVWRVVDTAEAMFQVDNYEDFVHVQSEAALRNLATRYPYDSHDGDHETSLRGNTAFVAEELKKEIQDRLEQAGVAVQEARFSHLAYSPEIAHAMLQRQQASAIIAARQKIVDGAVGMVEMALDRLAAKKIVDLDGERKAAMVSNLLVVLCSDRAASPVINAGTLY